MKKLAYTWILLVLVACGSLGLQEAKTFDDRLAYAYGVNTAIRDASTSALNAGTISSADMEYILPLNDQYRLALDAARQASSIGDITTAEGRLTATITGLTALQNYLRSKTDGR